jgi:sodium-dependent dicarboxylate transporter 2/3/5
MYPTYKAVGLILAPLLFVIFLLIPPPIDPMAWKVMACMIWMVLWWFTEAVPIPVTSLLPLVLFPLLQIGTMKDVAAPYASPIVYLFMGGFFIALAMEKSGLHRRIALTILRLTGSTANGIILGFMLATGFISMWVSNTATTVMMLPIAVSVISVLEQNAQISAQQCKMFALTLMLSIAYAANIGGMATLIGTPPNIVFAGFMQKTFQMQIGFVQWMIVATPISLVMLLITYLLLTKVMYPNRIGRITNSGDFIYNHLKELGKLSKAEKMVSMIFFITAFGWILRPQIESVLQWWIPGTTLSDTTIAMIGGLLVFVVPKNLREGQFLLAWEDCKKLPWGILLLFGGGLALADSMEKTGIIQMIGNTIQSYHFSTVVLLFVLVTIMVFITELMSNVALVTIFLPVVAGIAAGSDVNILLLAIPVTLSASAAFMLPMGTPPNAIVFASGHITMPQMARTGMALNIATVIIIGGMGYVLVKWVFGV